MYIVNNYTLAVIFCVVTMICWGSWGNTQKLAAKTWRYEYFYWDYVIGLLLFSILSAFTLGSVGSEGRSFLPDLAQADWSNIGSALLGGVVFNAANILLAAAIAICGLSVAFPVGIGLALVLGVLVNYFGAAKGAPLFIFIGVALIVVAIVLERTGLPENADRLEEGSRQGDRDFDRSGRNHGFLLPFRRGVDGSYEFCRSGSRGS